MRYKLYLVICLMISFVYGCKQADSYLQEGGSGNLRYYPYGIGLTTFYDGPFNYSSPYTNSGTNGLLQVDEETYFVTGFNADTQLVIAKKYMGGEISKAIDVVGIKGFSPTINDLFSASNFSLIKNEETLTCIYSNSINSIPLIKVNTGLTNSRIKLIEPFKIIGKYKNYSFSDVVACGDGKGGIYILFDCYYTDTQNMGGVLGAFFGYINSNDSLLVLKNISPNPILLRYINHNHNQLTLGSNLYMELSVHSVTKLMSGEYSPIWSEFFSHEPKMKYYAYGDSLLIVNPIASPGSVFSVYEGVQIRMVDKNTGNVLWNVIQKFEEVEDRFSCAITLDKNRLLVGYYGNVEGRLLLIDHYGLINSSFSIKGNQTVGAIDHMAVSNDMVSIFGLSGRQGSPIWQCFEWSLLIK